MLWLLMLPLLLLLLLMMLLLLFKLTLLLLLMLLLLLLLLLLMLMLLLLLLSVLLKLMPSESDGIEARIQRSHHLQPHPKLVYRQKPFLTNKRNAMREQHSTRCQAVMEQFIKPSVQKTSTSL